MASVVWILLLIQVPVQKTGTGEQPVVTESSQGTSSTGAGEQPETATEPQPDIGSQTVPDYAGPEDPADPRERVSFNYFTALGSLLFVLGLILGLAWLARRFLPSQLGGGTQGGNLKLIQSLPMGPKRFISLIEADGRRLLVGVTEHQINLIKSLDVPAFEETLSEVEDPKPVRELWEEAP